MQVEVAGSQWVVPKDQIVAPGPHLRIPRVTSRTEPNDKQRADELQARRGEARRGEARRGEARSRFPFRFEMFRSVRSEPIFIKATLAVGRRQEKRRSGNVLVVRAHTTAYRDHRRRYQLAEPRVAVVELDRLGVTVVRVRASWLDTTREEPALVRPGRTKVSTDGQRKAGCASAGDWESSVRFASARGLRRGSRPTYSTDESGTRCMTSERCSDASRTFA